MKIKLAAGDILNDGKSKTVQDVLGKAGLIVFPTETVYGLGCIFSHKEAVAEIYRLKGRSFNKPLAVFISSPEELSRYALKISSAAEKIIERFWPGPLTLVFKKTAGVPDIVSAGLETVGVRCSSSRLCCQLAAITDSKLAVTSANLSGQPSPVSAGEIQGVIADRSGIFIDGGTTEYRLESTVLDLSGSKPVLLREGAVPAKKLIGFL